MLFPTYFNSSLVLDILPYNSSLLRISVTLPKGLTVLRSCKYILKKCIIFNLILILTTRKITQRFKSTTKQDVSGETKATGKTFIFSPECYKIQKKLQALTGNQKRVAKR